MRNFKTRVSATPVPFSGTWLTLRILRQVSMVQDPIEPRIGAVIGIMLILRSAAGSGCRLGSGTCLVCLRGGAMPKRICRAYQVAVALLLCAQVEVRGLDGPGVIPRQSSYGYSGGVQNVADRRYRLPGQPPVYSRGGTFNPSYCPPQAPPEWYCPPSFPAPDALRRIPGQQDSTTLQPTPRPGTDPSTDDPAAPRPDNSQQEPGRRDPDVRPAIPDQLANPAGVDLTAFQPNAAPASSGAPNAARSRAMQSGANSIGDFFGGSLARKSLLFMDRSAVFFPAATVTEIGAVPPVLYESADQFRQLVTTVGGTELGETVFLRSSASGLPVATIPLSASGQSATTAEFTPLTDYPVLASDLTPGGLDVPTLTDIGPFVFIPHGAAPAFIDPYASPFISQPQAEFYDTNENGIFDPGEEIISFSQYRQVVIPSPGEMVGRLKVADNNSPIPRDRLILDYTLYSDTMLTTTGLDVHRFAPGFEKTFWGQRASIDVRLPFAKTLSNNITSYLTTAPQPFGLTDADDVVLGNLSATLKLLFRRTPYWTWSGGVQVHLPTAEDVHVYRGLPAGVPRTAADELVRIENKSLNVMPYLALMHTPNQDWWFQLYVQGDFDVTGNPVSIRGSDAVMRRVDTTKDVGFLYTDLSIGRWLYHDEPEIRTSRHGRFVDTAAYGKRGLTGLAGRFELHHNTALNNVESTGILDPATATHMVGEQSGGIDVVNLNLGLTATFGATTEVTVAWGRTVGSSSNQEFGDEVRVMVNLLQPVPAPFRTR